MVQRVIASTCRECFVGCGSLIHMEDEKVVKITGNPAHPHSHGAFCVKGQNAPITSLLHPDRPLYPLRRVGERGAGKWQRVSWNEALDEIAQRIGAVKRTHGARAIAGAVSNQFYDRGVAMALLLRSIGSPNYMINQDLCQGCRSTASVLTGLGAQPGNELQRARCIFVVGRSPSESNIVEWMDIKAAKRAGSKLIVVDPRRTQLAQMADLWLPVKPGTDAALALSMIHVLFSENLHDREFVEQWCAGAEDLRARASKYPPALAADITGIPAEKIIEAARTWAQEKPGSMVLGHGIDAQANGVYTAMAFQALLALSGNVDREGANRPSKGLPGFKDYVDITNDRNFRMPAEREREIIGGDKYPFWSGPASWGKAAHNPSVIEAMLSGDPYPVRAAYISGVNIVCTYPGMQRTVEALKGLDLLVVASDHITPTAELADFILPKTNLLEEEAVFSHEGPCLSIMQRAVQPRGEARTDVEIAIGLRDKLRQHELLDFDLLPWNTHRELIDYQLQDTGIRFDDLRATAFHAYPFKYEEFRTRGFNTPSGKVELASSKLEGAGYDALPDYREANYARPQGEFDLVLITGLRTMAYHHSRFHNHGWAKKVQNAPELKINPQTAARLAVSAGDWVCVETPEGVGRVYLQAKVTEEVPPDVVATGMGWWYPEMSGADHGALNFNVEAAIPYGPEWDPVSGSAEARNCACKLRRAHPSELPQWPMQTDARPQPASAPPRAP